VSFRRSARSRGGTADAPVRVIVLGLGNPGREYRDTRHNLGFMTVDEVARRLKAELKQREASALVGRARHPGDRGSAVLLAKPQTYMNLSGRSAAALLRKHGVEPADLWLVYDELDLPFGKLRIRKGGSAGGHNGVESVIEELGTQQLPRVRLGIGRPDAGENVDFLLTPFEPDERERALALVQLAADAVIDALREGFEISMNRYNGRSV
jgi:PTH1 family peptidyl-tRNA hydrolase